jgi:hypothetical protein
LKLIRKLVLGCVTVGFLATTLAATTYAWYKLGNAAFAESFEFNASTTEGFVVSVDGKNFKQKLSTEDIIKAMIVGKSPNNFKFDENGNLLDLRNNNLKLEGNNLAIVYQSVIALEPVTSKDGKTIKGLSGGTINETSESSSKYAYFNLYFRTVAASTEENISYDIYLDGLGYDDGHYSAPATSIWSDKATNVNLVANMTTYAKEYLKGEKVQVYTSNASRFSIQDLGYIKEETVEEPIYDEEDPTLVIDTKTTIVTTTTKPNADAKTFELSEDSQYDLGSFATDYNSTTDTRTDVTAEQKQALDKLYNSNYNAMYTYYNNIKTEDTLENKLPHFNTDLPQTIRSLTTFDENGVKINTKEVIATVKSGEVTKVAFRFWIEGWDGDCFDGLPGYLDSKYGLVTEEFDSNKTYYTRSGTGTDNDPYVYTKALINAFLPNVEYYQIVGTEGKEVNPINCRLLFNSIKVD